MDKKVIGLGIVVNGLAVAYEISAVVVVVKLIGVATGILHKGCMIERVVETDFIHIEEIVIHVDHLKTSELIAGGKYQAAAVLVRETVAGIICGSGVVHCVVGPAVLHYDGVKFLCRIPYGQPSVIYGQVNLLV